MLIGVPSPVIEPQFHDRPATLWTQLPALNTARCEEGRVLAFAAVNNKPNTYASVSEPASRHVFADVSSSPLNEISVVVIKDLTGRH